MYSYMLWKEVWKPHTIYPLALYLVLCMSNHNHEIKKFRKYIPIFNQVIIETSLTLDIVFLARTAHRDGKSQISLCSFSSLPSPPTIYT